MSFDGVNYDYDAVGNVVGYLAADAVGQTFTRTTNTLERFEGYELVNSLSRTTVASTGEALSQGGLAYRYDVNGHLVSTADPGQFFNPMLRTHNFVNDVAGNALYSYYASDTAPQQREFGQRQLIVNGEVLGRYGATSNGRISLAGQSVPTFVAEAEFSFGYQPINGSYPAGSPGTYAVGASDTLQTIAKGAYGDASLWYLIADANGLASNADLQAGQVLTIPTRVANANNANTFQPYDPSKVANDTPTMMAMPQDKGGCGGVGQVIMVVVAVAVAYFTAGAAAGALSPYLGTGAAAIGGTTGVSVATAAAAGAIGGAVGSIASQIVGNAIGAQDGFSWKGVALGEHRFQFGRHQGGVGMRCPVHMDSSPLPFRATGDFKRSTHAGSLQGHFSVESRQI